MLVQKVIEQLGFSPNEAKIYLTALGLGEARITEIASKAELPRTSAEAIANKLRTSGLMDFYIQRRYKYWVAENPEHLLSTIENREQAVRAAIPALLSIRRTAGITHRGGDVALQHAHFLRVLANASTQPMLITNEDAEIEYVNAAWEEQFGYELQEVHGETPAIFHSGETPRPIYDQMWTALRSGNTFQSDKIVDRKSDGSFFNLLTTLFPLDYAGRRYYVQILSEITEEKKAAALRKELLQIKTASS